MAQQWKNHIYSAVCFINQHVTASVDPHKNSEHQAVKHNITSGEFSSFEQRK
jgi:hypothetical protein